MSTTPDPVTTSPQELSEHRGSSDPETHQRAVDKPKAMRRIGDFRDAVDTLNWNRTDLSGATRDELKRMDVRTRLSRHIEIVEAMAPMVHPRFTLDLMHAANSVKLARDAIDRWTTSQD